MEYRLTAEQRAWRDRARAFAEEVVAPRAAALDAQVDPAAAFSWEIVEAADERGLRLAPLPTEYGGGGTDFLTNAVMLEEIAVGDMGIAVVLAQTWKFAQLLMELGTPDQRERWLPRLAKNPRGLMAASFTEPDYGSDNVLTYAGVDGGMQSTATKVDGGWVLRGQKHYISNSNRSDIILALMRTDPEVPVKDGCSAFIVPADHDAIRFGVVHDKMGERLANNSEIFYEDAFVPEEDLLGTENTILSDVARLLRGSNAYAAICTIGVARTALTRAIKRAKVRVQGGRPIIQHSVIAAELGDLWARLEAARTYVYRAAWAADHADPFDPKMAAAPKLVASVTAFEVTRHALEVFGGSGVMREVGMEKLLRDATIFLHSDGTNTIMRKKIAADLAARSDEQLDRMWDW
jgi:alkylation response protein AidB-like acyl-CoA dehydrogenase